MMARKKEIFSKRDAPKPADELTEEQWSGANSRVENNLELGLSYLIKSPCRDCLSRDELPGCIEGCEIISSINEVLANQISVYISPDLTEAYDIPNEVIEQIG